MLYKLKFQVWQQFPRTQPWGYFQLPETLYEGCIGLEQVACGTIALIYKKKTTIGHIYARAATPEGKTAEDTFLEDFRVFTISVREDTLSVAQTIELAHEFAEKVFPEAAPVAEILPHTISARWIVSPELRTRVYNEDVIAAINAGLLALSETVSCETVAVEWAATSLPVVIFSTEMHYFDALSRWNELAGPRAAFNMCTGGTGLAWSNAVKIEVYRGLDSFEQKFNALTLG